MKSAVPWLVILVTSALVAEAVSPSELTEVACTNFFGTTAVTGFEYQYDLLGRPVRRNDDAYAYDLAGNRTASSDHPLGTKPWTANALNQTTAVGNEPFLYDADGNLVAEWNDTLFWDAENRFVTITNEGFRRDNAYDWRSRRIRTEHGALDEPQDRRLLVYDGWNIVYDRRDEWNSTDWERYREVDFFWGPDLSGTLQGAGGVGGLVAVSIAGQYYFPCYDNLGNVVAYVDENGAKVASYTYDAFGYAVSLSGSMSETFPHRFSTKWQDNYTLLYDYGYRWYRPDIGRWMNRDPIGEEGGENLYEFCRNTPTFCFDLFGQEIYYFINQQYLDQTEQEYGISGKSGPDSFENVSIISKVDDLNLATEKTGQPEFHITYKKFDSLSSLIKLTETSSSSDHIIVHTHGAPSGIFFGDTVTIYNSEEMKCFIEALKNHAQTLTLRVCHVSSENAEAIKKDAELKSIYYSSTENQMRIGDFGLWPVWDPADTFRILRYEYSPEKSGLQKKQ